MSNFEHLMIVSLFCFVEGATGFVGKSCLGTQPSYGCIDLSTTLLREQKASIPRTNVEDSTPPAFHSSILGDIFPLKTGYDDDFLGKMAVPTYKAAISEKAKDLISDSLSQDHKDEKKTRGIEGAIGQGPAFVLENLFSADACKELINTFESVGFGSYQAGKNFHGALQVLVPPEISDYIGKALGRHIDVQEIENLYHEMMRHSSGANSHTNEQTHDVRLVYSGINRRFRIYRYAPGGEERFSPHIDAGFPPSGLTDDGQTLLWDDTVGKGSNEVVSRLTLLMYLNDDFLGGETKFYQPLSQTIDGENPEVIASIRPIAGACLVFPQGVGEEAVDHARQHWPLHEGSPVRSGAPKYVIRSDVLFTTQKEPLPLNDALFCNDHYVRQAFLPRSPAFSPVFMNHASSLYNPHMGVENLGYFLYSFLRFTKKRNIVEIGAGYTSLWIAQALKDNDDEIERVRTLGRSGKALLMNIPWAIPDIVENFGSREASLLMIDNCKHQKETATGAFAVAKSLGLDSYMKFVQGDAFDLELEDSTIDVLWCDFGVGARMKEYISSAWSSLRPGGFLLCHSTLTNERTRKWLEDARKHRGEEYTGLPAHCYTELSLLEPHKRFQNSVSIFQKRTTSSDAYNEPIYSEFA